MRNLSYLCTLRSSDHSPNVKLPKDIIPTDFFPKDIIPKPLCLKDIILKDIIPKDIIPNVTLYLKIIPKNHIRREIWREKGMRSQADQTLDSGNFA